MKFLAAINLLFTSTKHFKEFTKAHLAEVDEHSYIYMGDKHYFEFELTKTGMHLVEITDVIYS